MLSLCGTRLRVAEHRLDGLGDGVMPMVSARACVACVWPRDIDGGSKPCMHDGGAGGAAPPGGGGAAPRTARAAGKFGGLTGLEASFMRKPAPQFCNPTAQTELIIAYRFALCVYLIFI